jgi:hypothetical protein
MRFKKFKVKAIKNSNKRYRESLDYLFTNIDNKLFDINNQIRTNNELLDSLDRGGN